MTSLGLVLVSEAGVGNNTVGLLGGALLVDRVGAASGSLGVGGEHVDLGRGELASRYLLLEEDVEGTVGSVLGLGEAEEGPDDAEEAGTSPEESRLRSPVPLGGVEHAGREDVGDDTANVVGVTGEHDGLGTETSRGDLGNETVAD